MTADEQAVQGHGVDRQQWEEAALQLGWLRECPYHGEPFRTAGASRPAPAAQETGTRPLQGPWEAALRAKELLHAYDEQCPLCARESALPE